MKIPWGTEFIFAISLNDNFAYYFIKVLQWLQINYVAHIFNLISSHITGLLAIYWKLFQSHDFELIRVVSVMQDEDLARTLTYNMSLRACYFLTVILITDLLIEC